MRLQLRLTEERWALREPFEIAGQVMHEVPLLQVQLRSPDGIVGWAEAAGIDYDGETLKSMRRQLESIATQLSTSTTGDDLMGWLPRGGARNALDCAWWDWRAKRAGVPVWALAGLERPQPLQTACTIGLGSLSDMRRRARELAAMPVIKVKVDGQRHLEALGAVRQEAPGARLLVDANQSWSRSLLERLLPDLAALGVELVEQPVPRDADATLEGLSSPIPLAADESCTDRLSLPALVNRYQVVNIKLDKCGGLTEALALARQARAMGMEVMVGNMCGTSLGMAPAFLVAQLARWVDLDGPLLQTTDRRARMRYEGGTVHPPEPALWG